MQSVVGGLHLLHSRRDIIAAFWQGSELIGCRAEVARESRRRGWCVFGTSSPCGGTLDARPHLPAESSDGEAVVQSRRPERGENHRPPRPSGWARSANLPTASPRWLLTSATWRPSPAARREASVSLCCCRSDLGEGLPLAPEEEFAHAQYFCGPLEQSLHLSRAAEKAD